MDETGAYCTEGSKPERKTPIQYKFSSVAHSCVTLCDPVNRSTPGLPVHHWLLESTQTHVHWVSDATQRYHPLSSPSPPALNLSQRQGLFKGSAPRIRWPKYWSFKFNISLSNEHPGLISFRMDLLGLLEVQGTLKSLLQHHSSKASILQPSVFFIVQLSYPYMTTGKIIALTRQTFVGKIISLLFNMLSRLVITFLPRSKCLLISWLKSPFAVILDPRKINSATVCSVLPSICHEVLGPDAMIFVFWMLSFKPTFSLSSFIFIKRLFSSSLSAIKVVSSAYLRLLIFLPAILIPSCERLLLNDKTPGFLASGGDEFNPGPETRLDHSELLCNKILLKYKGGRESFWHRHQKGAKQYPPPSL